MSQIALPLDWPPADPDDAFIVSPCNADAVRHLAAPGRWPVPVTLLTGPRKSGRSLLARVTASRINGSIFDFGDRPDERALFAAWNEAVATRQPLIIIADKAPPEWEITLPDLRSRLAATPHVALADPDGALVERLIQRLLERRNLSVSPGVSTFLGPRIERCHYAVIALVDALDEASLAARRPITVPLARSVLAGIQEVARAG